jgi:hypothetical protein
MPTCLEVRLRFRTFIFASLFTSSLIVAACTSETTTPSAEAGASCCVPSTSPASCMVLGGEIGSLGCSEVCDFPQSATSFVLETGESGCSEWRWDANATDAGVVEADPDANVPPATALSETTSTASDPAAGAVTCCPPDETTAGCMHLGGTNRGDNSCNTSCDFFCSTHWRLETNEDGCAEWRYDLRSPTADENASCFKKL